MRPPQPEARTAETQHSGREAAPGGPQPFYSATPLCVLGGPCDVKGKDGAVGKLQSENCQGKLHCFTLISRTLRAGHPCRRNPVQEKQMGDGGF